VNALLESAVTRTSGLAPTLTEQLESQRRRLPVRANRAIWARPRVGDFRAGEQAGQSGLARLHSALHPGTGCPNGLRNVEDTAFGVPAFAQAHAYAKITAWTKRARNNGIVFSFRRSRSSVISPSLSA
jgi:hypothetical protein